MHQKIGRGTGSPKIKLIVVNKLNIITGWDRKPALGVKGIYIHIYIYIKPAIAGIYEIVRGDAAQQTAVMKGIYIL